MKKPLDVRIKEKISRLIHSRKQNAPKFDSSPSSQNLNRSYFDDKAGEYDDRFDLSLHLSCARAAFIRQRLNAVNPNATCLELGCGTGNLTKALCMEGLTSRCIGMDISPGMISVAKKKFLDSPECSFIVASALSLPFESLTFDLCVGDAFLHHIVDAAACLREINRVLKPGGAATFNEPSLAGYGFLEFIIRTILAASRCEDEGLNIYLRYLTFMREHEGDLEALENFPQPDKHFFSKKAWKTMASDSGFYEIVVVPAIDRFPGFWVQCFKPILSEMKVNETLTELIINSAQLIEKMMGDSAFDEFFLHNQVFLYKK